MDEPARTGTSGDAAGSSAEAFPPPFDTSVAHPARVYDYWLGGKDNFAPDREAAEQVIRANPGILPGVRSNRAFLGRVVRTLVADLGVGQLLDLGTGLPSADNVHEVAQRESADARVVYVDNDPIVLTHARALLTGTPGTVAYIDADLRRPERVLAEASRTLDLTRPVAVLLLMTLQFVADEDDPYGLVRTYLDATPSGSYLVVSHPAADTDTGGVANAATAKYNERVSTPMTRRTYDEVAAFFDGLELVEPGIVSLPQWRPDPGSLPLARVSPNWCGVAVKP